MDETDRLGIHLQDRPLELVEQKGRELLLRLLRRSVVAVGVAHVPHLGDERLERRAERLDAVDRQGPKGRTVVGDVAGDRLVLVARRGAADLTRNHLAGLDAFHLLRAPTHREVLPRQLPRRLHRLGAARDEEDPIEVTRRQRRNLGRQLDRARMRVRPIRIERQLPHLRKRRPADLLPKAVTEVDRKQSRQRVEITPAIHVLEITAVAAHNDRRLLTMHIREVEPEMIVRQTAELLGGRRALRDAHPVVSSFGIPLPQS